ncbi:NAD3 (mitochondrion) [Schistosoma bovis]|uniref:NADH-ubiquinone oxidoreductase chain 3 n=1 Tax=Schistosoma bovis TaxID=6184 RepID=A0A430PWT1_SCHBO|nr:NAD3 [Schistosoma bovis]
MSNLSLVLLTVIFSVLLLVGLVHYSVFGVKHFEGNRYSNMSEWYSSFECGFLGHGLNENFFSFSYLNLLILFVVFDLEISLLLNIVYDGIWYYTFWCYFFFFFFLVLGYMAELKLGYIKWIN